MGGLERVLFEVISLVWESLLYFAHKHFKVAEISHPFPVISFPGGAEPEPPSGTLPDPPPWQRIRGAPPPAGVLTWTNVVFHFIVF